MGVKSSKIHGRKWTNKESSSQMGPVIDGFWNGVMNQHQIIEIYITGVGTVYINSGA
jgi:hypothetical protein